MKMFLFFFFFSCSSVLFILSFPDQDFQLRYKRSSSAGNEPLCRESNIPVDSVYDFKPKNYSAETTTETARRKRFILFPEFVNFLNDYRYLQQAPKISYWISNFYPEKISRTYIEGAFLNIMKDINEVLDEKISYQPATDVKLANFVLHFFDYTICPTKDNVDPQIISENTPGESLLIYPAELVRKSRYRAHGGMFLRDDDTPISVVKLNMQQTFLVSNDYVYDQIVYTCVSDELNICTIDLYYVLLHEVLHGFGIEHTANQVNSTPPNPQMKSVMHFSAIRILCHDDVRAIRMVYRSKPNRENAKHDDTCRRDFPLNFWQKLIRKVTRAIRFGFILFVLISTILFILTILYILLRKFIRRTSDEDKEMTPSNVKTRNLLPRGYLYHDEML